MDPKSLAVPAPLQHTADTKNDAALAKAARAHLESHAGLRFLADVVRALHTDHDALRNGAAFHARFPARVLMSALEQRPDLRARIAHAITLAPTSLARRLSSSELAAQIELLVAEDLPADERSQRAEEDRTRSVPEIYLRRVDADDAVVYLPAREVWAYESHDGWWERGGDASRKLMAAELKSVRRHKLLSDSEILDAIGDEVLERDLPLKVRVELRTAARNAGAEGKPFTDGSLLDSMRGEQGRELIDEIVASVPLPHLRSVVQKAADAIGLTVTKSTAAAARPSAAAPKMPSARPPASTTPSMRPPPAAAIPAEAIPLVSKSVRPPAAANEPSNGKAGRNGSTKPAAARSSDAPLVALIEDENYGAEQTNSGNEPIEADIAEFPDVSDESPTDVHRAGARNKS